MSFSNKTNLINTHGNETNFNNHNHFSYNNHNYPHDFNISVNISQDFFNELVVGKINYQCRHFNVSKAWIGIKILILVTGLPLNVILFLLFVCGRIANSAAQALSLNLCLLHILYCVCLPLDICTSFIDFPDKVTSASEALSALNIVGCPLLAAAMCLERYVAVTRPFLYLKLRESNCQLVVSVLIWALTLALLLMVYFKSLKDIDWPLTVGISLLYLLILMCLSGIIFQLCRSAVPGDNVMEEPQKKRALIKVLAVLTFFTVGYLPILTYIPVQILLKGNSYEVNTTTCSVFLTFTSLPNFGIYIDPFFNLCCYKQLLVCQTWWSGQSQTQRRTNEMPSRC